LPPLEIKCFGSGPKALQAFHDIPYVKNKNFKKILEKTAVLNLSSFLKNQKQ